MLVFCLNLRWLFMNYAKTYGVEKSGKMSKFENVFYLMDYSMVFVG